MSGGLGHDMGHHLLPLASSGFAEVAGGSRCCGSRCLPLVLGAEDQRTLLLLQPCWETLFLLLSCSALAHPLFLTPLSLLEHRTAQHHPISQIIKDGVLGWAQPMGGCPVSVGAFCSIQLPWGPCSGWAMLHPPHLGVGVGLGVPWEGTHGGRAGSPTVLWGAAAI